MLGREGNAIACQVRKPQSYSRNKSGILQGAQAVLPEPAAAGSCDQQPRPSCSGPLCLHPAPPAPPALPGAAHWTPLSADPGDGSWHTTVYRSHGAEPSPCICCSQLLISTTTLFFLIVPAPHARSWSSLRVSRCPPSPTPGSFTAHQSR